MPRSAAKASPGSVPGRISPDVGSRAQVYLHPGQLAVASKPTAITTVLGSCVAVCLHDPVAGVGGMNHFLLHHHVERERSARFGTVAIPDLVSAVLRAGAKRVSLVAKVFGGANALAGVPTGRRLGDENALLALRMLEESGIPVLDKDVGGNRGRKVVFVVDEGTVWVRHL